ncbi:hypothetical protein [Corynebacterium propinquum]|uniref:Type ISP restriction-modification enzyme LLaBIII C-terminal specificity domain-containing protein n=1 Tax=Corynebacterium propinquum TaxID=43769 RepID=A0ABT7G315_9CORY|nr:hypothetical protein [Corynebacterium propinquum]MDK4301015.1 hypothetical protein [Corynebacterium propinquum]MDK4313108.1 hypothetical protein [Corynebacterium propinquum]
MHNDGWGYESWEDYYIPGTKVVRNKFRSADKPYGEDDPDRLREMEEFVTAVRITMLQLQAISTTRI